MQLDLPPQGLSVPAAAFYYSRLKTRFKISATSEPTADMSTPSRKFPIGDTSFQEVALPGIL
jgi:hypothetical protein